MTYAASASQPTRAHVRDRNGRVVAAGVITAGASLEPVLSSVDRLERSVRQISGRAIENHAAGRHADDAIGKAFRELDVVHIDDDRNVSIAGDVGEQLHDFDRGLRVERGGWLVGEQHRGLLHHRARDADAPALGSTRRLMQRINVLLPVPDGPMIAVMPRAAMSRLMSFKTGLPGTYDLVRCLIESMEGARSFQSGRHSRLRGDDAAVSDRHDGARLALGQPRHFFLAASAASLAVSFSYEALSKLPPEPFATSRTTAQAVL